MQHDKKQRVCVCDTCSVKKYYERGRCGRDGIFLDSPWDGEAGYEHLLKAWQENLDFRDEWWRCQCLVEQCEREA